MTQPFSLRSIGVPSALALEKSNSLFGASVPVSF